VETPRKLPLIEDFIPASGEPHAEAKMNCGMEKTKTVADESTSDLYAAPEETETTVEVLTTQNESGAVIELTEPPDKAVMIKQFNEVPTNEFDALLSRPYPVATLTWASTDAVYSSLYTLYLPDILLDIPQISRIWTNYWKYAQWDSIEISVQPNMAVGAQGTLLISRADCQASGTGYRMHTGYLGQKFQLPCYRVSASVSTSLRFELPWNHNHPVWTLGSTDSDMHALEFIVLHPLGTSQGSAYSGEVTIWAKFNGLKFIMPRPASIVVADSYGKGKKKAKQEAADKSDNNSFVSTASSVEQVIDSGIHIFEKLADVAGRLAPMLALLDKPTSTQSPMPTFHLPGRDMALISGLDWVAPLSSHPQAGTGDSLRFAEQENPTIADVASTPSLMGRNTYTSPAGGDILAVLAVSPHWGFYGQDSDFVPSWAGYAVAPYRFYRGGMKFQLNFATSQFVSMKVAVTFLAEVAAATTVDSDTFGDAYTIVCDVLGDTTCEFAVPYVSSEVWTQSTNSQTYAYGVTGTALYPYIVTTGSFPASFNFANGQIVVHVLNKAVTNDPSIAPVVYLDIWASMAEDFQAGMLINPDPVVDTGILYHYTAPEVKSRQDDLEGKSDIVRRTRKNVRYNPKSGTVNANSYGDEAAPVSTTRESFKKPFDYMFAANPSMDDNLCMSEQNLDWLEPTKRYYDGNPPVATENYNWWSPYAYYMYAAINVPTNQYHMDNLTWFVYPFLWLRGSTRYRFIFDRSAADLGKVWTRGSAAYAEDTWGRGAGPQNLQVSSECHFQGVECPWYCGVPMTKTECFTNYVGEFNSGLTPVQLYMDSPSSYTDYYWALGDDFRAYQLMSTPALYISSGAQEEKKKKTPLERPFVCEYCDLACKDKESFISHSSGCVQRRTALDSELSGNEKRQHRSGVGSST